MTKLYKALIGIIADYKEGDNIGYSKRPYYAINKSYVDAINISGGTAMIIPYDYEAIDQYLKLIDGLMIVGGHFDISPIRYGENIFHPAVKLNKAREDFEYEIMAKALEKKNLPIFGICNGMQLIGVINGSKIIQHILDHKGKIDHEQSHNPDFKDYKKPYHDILIKEGTKLFEIIGKKIIKVNSSHHQAIMNTKRDIIIAAKSDDGIIEAIEDSKHPFCLGVQWHPEFLNEEDKKLFASFIEACRKYKIIHKN